MESRLAVCVILILALVVGVTSQQTTSQPIPRSLLEVCGKAQHNGRIVGGSDAASGSWPWMAIVHSRSKFCGGTLINNEWILSAAHCWSSIPSDVTVYLGRQNHQVSSPEEVSRNVSQIIIHSNFSSVTFDNDIALLKLSSSVRFTDYIRPVCLAAKGSAFSDGSTTWVTGWGRINTNASLPYPGRLQEVEVPILDDAICKSFYKHFTDNMICAGRKEKGICFGDSGGPMVVKQGERWIQIGVNSFTWEKGCAIGNNPDGYARVSPYQSWIEKHITSNQPGFVYSSSNVTSSNSSNVISSMTSGRSNVFSLLLLYILHPVFSQ